MSAERWDVVVEVLDGPLAGRGHQTLRGPVVQVGARPGVDGLAFPAPGYRGLEDRHCTISVYGEGTARLRPIGRAQVRTAPFGNIRWETIDPLPGEVHLARGDVVHVGPVGRGATLRFIEARRLGDFVANVRIGSDAADIAGNSALPTRGVRRPPDAIPVRVRTIDPEIPTWFRGAALLIAAFGLTVAVMALLYVFRPKPRPIGPVEEGLTYYESVSMDDITVPMELQVGLRQPFKDFIINPDIEAAGGLYAELDRVEAWDQVYYDHVSASFVHHVESMSFFRQLDNVVDDYARVSEELAEAGLPAVLAGIPYRESRYMANQTSDLCAGGYWQFMLETSYRLRTYNKLGDRFVVDGCRYRGGSGSYTFGEVAPPSNIRTNPPGYVTVDGKGTLSCRVDRCTRDDRRVLGPSTRAAIAYLGETWKDPTLRGSGAAVQITILSHHAGYDDARFGRGKGVNMLPAYKRWVAKAGAKVSPHFYGKNLTCPSHEGGDTCGAVIQAGTQHYAYTVTAQHFAAVCYYAINYPDRSPIFQEWANYYTGDDGYCSRVAIPSREEVRKPMGKKG